MTVSGPTFAAIRFGYGFHPVQTPPDGPAALLASLDRGARAPMIFAPAPVAEKLPLMQELPRMRRAGMDAAAQRPVRRALRAQAMAEAASRLLQRALSPHGFFERLAGFWGDHFTIGIKNVGQRLMIPDFEPAAIRPHVTGTFGDMLVAAARHPAMLVFLDQVASVGPGSPAGQRTGRGLNENLAREILELHTLGVDADYAQADVRAFAEVLTGYGIERRTFTFKFFPARAEPGVRTVLGRSYGGARAAADHAEGVLRDLAVHPATAAHLAQKLAHHFVADRPSPDLVRHMAAAWQRTGGHLPAVYAALVEHPAAWTGFGAKAKRPRELVISTLRASGITRAQAPEIAGEGGRRLIRALRGLGQPLQRPPGPQGWPDEASAWITPQGLAARLAFAGQIGRRLAGGPEIDPRAFAQTALGDALRPDTAFAVAAAPERWEGIAFALASPEFNRR